MKKEALKEEAILLILNKYKIHVDIRDDSYLNIKKRVRIDSGDSFSKWKEKVFGSKTADVTVHGVENITPNTLFSNVQKKYPSDSIPKAINRKIKSIEKELENNLKAKIIGIKSEFEQRETEMLQVQKKKIIAERKKVETFSVDLLKECVEEQETSGIELSVKQFFDRWLNSGRRIETRDILKKLIRAYNSSVAAARRTTT
jgi:hypothetical protein